MYKRLFIGLVVSVYLCNLLHAQANYADMLMKAKQERIPRYSLLAEKEAYILIRMPFNSDSVLDPKALRSLAKDFNAGRIDLVYTAFRESETFDQPELNRSRLNALFRYAPQLAQNPMTEWHFIAQTGATTVDSATKLFHGFVIYPKRRGTVADIEQERELMKRTMDSIEAFITANDSICVAENVIVKKRRVTTGYYVAYSNAQGSGKRSEKKTARYRYAERIMISDTIVKRDSVSCADWAIDGRLYRLLPDSTVISVLEQHPEWKDMLVLTDVTASMSQFTTQLLVWHRLRQARGDVKMFGFFNDGDNIPDYKKAIGRTGGLYFIEAKQKYAEVAKTMQTAMRKGFGGDEPENNIEALLKGQELCPACKDIIMIADNGAAVKDIALLPKVTRPVKVILCDIQGGIINTHYLDIARKTSGLVHVPGKDIKDLNKLNEGDTIIIGKRIYKVVNDRFIIAGYM